MSSTEETVIYPAKGATALQALEGVDLSGKTIMVTGCNVGIGFQTARALAVHNAHVIMACRNMKTATEAKDKIIAESKDAKITVLKLDLSSFESVEECAAEYLKNDWPLHALILNAGVWGGAPRTTGDGFEIHFQINHLAQFHLTQLLLERLVRSAPSRVVVVSSDFHKYPFGTITLDKVSQEKLSPPADKMNLVITGYCMSKTLNVLFARELNSRWAEKGVTGYSLHPGAIKSELGRHTAMGSFISRFLKSPEIGASTSVFLATAPGLEKSGAGGYYWDCRPATPSAGSQNKEIGEKLWKLSEELVAAAKEKRKELPTVEG